MKKGGTGAKKKKNFGSATLIIIYLVQIPQGLTHLSKLVHLFRSGSCPPHIYLCYYLFWFDLSASDACVQDQLRPRVMRPAPVPLCIPALGKKILHKFKLKYSFEKVKEENLTFLKV